MRDYKKERFDSLFSIPNGMDIKSIPCFKELYELFEDKFDLKSRISIDAEISGLIPISNIDFHNYDTLLLVLYDISSNFDEVKEKYNLSIKENKVALTQKSAEKLLKSIKLRKDLLTIPENQNPIYQPYVSAFSFFSAKEIVKEIAEKLKLKSEKEIPILFRASNTLNNTIALHFWQEDSFTAFRIRIMFDEDKGVFRLSSDDTLSIYIGEFNNISNFIRSFNIRIPEKNWLNKIFYNEKHEPEETKFIYVKHKFNQDIALSPSKQRENHYDNTSLTNGIMLSKEKSADIANNNTYFAEYYKRSQLLVNKEERYNLDLKNIQSISL